MLTKTFEKRITNLEKLTADQKIPRRDFTQKQLSVLFDWTQLRLSNGGFRLDDGTENALIHLLAIAKAKYERENRHAD